MGYPLANVNISIKGTSEGIQTDANGKYEIEAQPRDVL
ncbi:MAG: carboxypeptidase-like regulatory domain-containing protein, partial [Maribacter sp.]|nr:carboxypeptidase-like regulatory domain-containing protein [Maribacter sp.]